MHNSILSTRTFVHTSTILLPTILLSLLFYTISTPTQSCYTVLCSFPDALSTWDVGIIFAGLGTCLAVLFSATLLIPYKCIYKMHPRFNLKAFERQHLNQIWPYIGLFIICQCIYNLIYRSFESSLSKVHLTIDVRMYGSIGLPFSGWYQSVSPSSSHM